MPCYTVHTEYVVSTCSVLTGFLLAVLWTGNSQQRKLLNLVLKMESSPTNCNINIILAVLYHYHPYKHPSTYRYKTKDTPIPALSQRVWSLTNTLRSYLNSWWGSLLKQVVKKLCPALATFFQEPHPFSIWQNDLLEQPAPGLLPDTLVNCSSFFFVPKAHVDWI